MKHHSFQITLFVACLMATFAADRIARASDHADPIIVRFLGRPESNLTGLFAFEAKDKLVVALCARPGLADTLVDLKPLTFNIHIDTDSRISFHKKQLDDEGRTYRYGGWIHEPDNISEDLSIQFRFDSFRKNPFEKVRFGDAISITPKLKTSFDDNRKKKQAFEQQLRTWVGLRDDPFILHGFSTTNVVAMVVEIPFEFLGDNREILIWGTAEKYGKPIDHVGRTLRTMLPRFDFLNTLHPKDHVKAIRERHEAPGVAQDLMRYFAGPFFGIRHYDFEPDVVVFSQARWHAHAADRKKKPNEIDINDYDMVAFPNGRRLTDDVALLMRDRGDALLYEVSTAEAHADHKLRPTQNGSDYLSEFPYLAPPNENPTVPEMPHLRWRTIFVLALVGLAVLSFFALPWILYWRARKKIRRLESASA